MSKRYFVYILASKPNGTLYVGVTGDLANRTWQHKTDLIDGFTKKYGVHLLVWFEEWATCATQSIVRNRSRAGTGHGRSN